VAVQPHPFQPQPFPRGVVSNRSCPHCGHWLGPKAQRCIYCGASDVGSASGASEQPPSGRGA
jgi:uncharacterized OB-fold protein